MALPHDTLPLPCGQILANRLRKAMLRRNGASPFQPRCGRSLRGIR